MNSTTETILPSLILYSPFIPDSLCFPVSHLFRRCFNTVSSVSVKLATINVHKLTMPMSLG